MIYSSTQRVDKIRYNKRLNKIDFLRFLPFAHWPICLFCLLPFAYFLTKTDI